MWRRIWQKWRRRFLLFCRFEQRHKPKWFSIFLTSFMMEAWRILDVPTLLRPLRTTWSSLLLGLFHRCGVKTMSFSSFAVFAMQSVRKDGCQGFGGQEGLDNDTDDQEGRDIVNPAPGFEVDTDALRNPGLRIRRSSVIMESNQFVFPRKRNYNPFLKIDTFYIFDSRGV